MKMTVADIIKELEVFPKGWEVTFGPNPSLTFYRLKKRGAEMVNFEFNETPELADIFPASGEE